MEHANDKHALEKTCYHCSMQEDDWVKNPFPANPFSTVFWASGILPFQFTPPPFSKPFPCAEKNACLESLQQFIQQHARCQIVGPHGSGKSTLLQELLKRYKNQGENVQYLFFNDQNRRVPSHLPFSKNTIFFVDGFEQLSCCHRYRLLLRAKRLVFTTHHPMWFVPILYRTEPQFTVFANIVSRLTADLPETLILLEEPVLRSLFEQSGGNFRSAFFELYDRWERKFAESHPMTASY